MSEGGNSEGYNLAAERVERALARLEASLRGLNSRVRSIARIELEVKRLEDDRAALADELSRTNSKAKKLDATASDVSRRLVNAMETVKTVLADEEQK